MSTPLSNRAVENAAIDHVIAHETSQGRKPVDTRGKGAPADVESDDAQGIDVKAHGGTARGHLWLEAPQAAEAEANFWVHVVDIRQRDPALFGLRDGCSAGNNSPLTALIEIPH